MAANCPIIACSCEDGSPKTSHFVRIGFFYRKSDSRYIRRWRCVHCKKTYSQSTAHPCFGQNKRRVNFPLARLLCSGVSMRRAAKVLHIHRKTVARKMHFLAEQARLGHAFWLRSLGKYPLARIQFDEMETFEHTKYKPLSLPIAVTPQRKILGVLVASMPAKGLLAARAKKKYGYRKSERRKKILELLRSLKGSVREDAVFESDMAPNYPWLLKSIFPKAQHRTTLGRRACVVGQGELKRGEWDPLFSLNHTAAMLRANMNRLFRRTWCTTKTVQGLKDHLAIYIGYHNGVLTPQ